jgi:hypothetical protein
VLIGSVRLVLRRGLIGHPGVARALAGCLGAGAACLVLVGCGGRNYLNENDKLRSDNLALRQTVQELEESLRLRVAQVDSLQQAQGLRSRAEGAAASDLPRVVKVGLGRLSGAVDTDGDGHADLLRLYVLTNDQQGRFIPAIGPATVQAVAIEPGEPPRVLAERSFTPKEFVRAYRTGLMGTHFTLELPLPAALPEGVETATVKIVFTDASTGARLSCEEVVTVRLGT